MDEYIEIKQWIEEHRGKLFINGFEVVELADFIISPSDQEPCYKVICFIGCPPRFYYSEVPVIMGLHPLDTLPNYDEIVEQWRMNFSRVMEILPLEPI